MCIRDRVPGVPDHAAGPVKPVPAAIHVQVPGVTDTLACIPQVKPPDAVLFLPAGFPGRLLRDHVIQQIAPDAHQSLVPAFGGCLRVLALGAVAVSYTHLVTGTEAAAAWWGPVLALVVAFYVAFLAMYGWEKLAQLWARYRHPGGSA